MRFRLVEIKGHRLAAACESISGNPAVHNVSADDYRLAGVVFASTLVTRGGVAV